MPRYLRLFWGYLRIGVMNELQYRANFIMQVLQALLALGTGLAGLALVFTQTDNLAGWTLPELMAVMGTHILMGGIIRTSIQPNMMRLMTDVLEGTLDYALAKPTDSQALISIREFRLWQLVDVAVGGLVLLYAAVQMQTRVGVVQVALFLVALALGAMMIYSFWLVITTGAFWIVRIDNILELFEGVYQAGRWPIGVYPEWLRLGLTFLVPVAFAVTVPAEALTQRLTPATLLGAAALAAGLLVFSRWFWHFGLRHYSGASA